MPLLLVAIGAFFRWIIGRLVAAFSSRLGQFITGIVASIIAGNWREIQDAFNELINTDDIKAEAVARVLKIVADHAADRLGIVLDPNDPLSVPSLSAGIGGKIGIPLTNILDKEAVLADVSASLAQRVNDRAGTNFTALWPVETLLTNLQTEAVVAVGHAARSQSTWLNQSSYFAIRDVIKQIDKGMPAEDTKATRKRMLHRLAQRKYQARMYRPYPWIPRTIPRDPVIEDLMKQL